MSKLVTDKGVVEEAYSHLGDDEAAPATGAITVSVDRWQQESDLLSKRRDPVGVRLANTFSLNEATPDLLARPLIVLEFPVFADGRAYSQARVLRQAHGYTGELRARGEAVVVDQVSAMQRCGIDSFQLRADQDANRAVAALKGSRPVYQTAVNDPGPSVRRQRRERPAA